MCALGLAPSVVVSETWWGEEKRLKPKDFERKNKTRKKEQKKKINKKNKKSKSALKGVYHANCEF